MELRQLRYFVETASRLSFRQAAEKLYVTQPAISRQISELEHELGVPLFTRDTRHVALTEPGQILLERAKQILALVDETTRAVLVSEPTERRSLRVGVLRFGTPTITDLLRLYCNRHPHVSVEFREGETSAHLGELTADGEVDASLGQLIAFERHGLETTLLQTHEIVALVHPSHPFSSRTSIPIDALATESLVAHAGLWQIVRAWFREAGVRPRLLRDTMPAGGTALSILLYMRNAVALWNSGLNPVPHGTSLVRLVPAPLVPYGLGWRRGKKSHEVEALADLVRESSGKLGSCEATGSVA